MDGVRATTADLAEAARYGILAADLPIDIRRGPIFKLTILPLQLEKDERTGEKVALAQGPRDGGIVADAPEERSVMDDGCPLLKQL
jgi:hypothetical protein